MKARSTYLLLAVFALGALALGVAALRFLPAAGGRGGGAKIARLGGHPAGGTILPGLRRALAPEEPPASAAVDAAPVSPEGPAPAQTPNRSASSAKPAPIPEAPSPEQQAGVEGLVSFPPVAPVPPVRPADLPAPETQIPLPPVRPTDLAAVQPAPAAPAPAQPPQPEAAPQQQAPPQQQAATQPPTPGSTGGSWFQQWSVTPQPRTETPTAAAPAAPTAGQQTARLSEPTLRPAPDDAFQGPPPKFGMGDPVFVRIFKQEGQLELWLKKSGRYTLYKTFPICKWSGRLGPKVKEGDYQSPEGFYSVTAKQLNPHSNYYRAFNVGYPNAFDRQNGRTGGLVMVHGACMSVGCFAMTDRGIEEIYGFVEAALKAGQKEVPVHIFPFRMTEANIARETGGSGLAFIGGWSYQQWAGFWKNLKEGFDRFERTGEPPVAFACGDHYEFDGGSSDCRRVAGW